MSVKDNRSPGNFASRITLGKGILDELADILEADLLLLESMLESTSEHKVEEALEYIRAILYAIHSELGELENE